MKFVYVMSALLFLPKSVCFFSRTRGFAIFHKTPVLFMCISERECSRTVTIDSSLIMNNCTDQCLDDDISSSPSLSTAFSYIPLRSLKVRQHVNPLAGTYQKPSQLSENWIKESFQNPNLPFLLDIGIIP